MIPDEKSYPVVDITSRRRIGVLDESFVISNIFEGESFILQGRPWKVVGIDNEEVIVTPIKDIGKVPSWIGEDIPVPFEVAQEVGRLRRELKEEISKDYPCRREDLIKLKEFLEELIRCVDDEGNIREKDGAPLAFTLLYPDDELHQSLAELAKENWEKIGVGVTLQAMPYDQLIYNALTPRQYQAALADLNLMHTPDPDPYPFWHQAEVTGGQNYAQWDNRAASEYLEQARITADIAERTRLYRNFQVIFAEELPAIPLFYPVYTFGVDSQVRGVQGAPLYDTSDRLANIASWYLITRRALEPTPTVSPQEK